MQASRIDWIDSEVVCTLETERTVSWFAFGTELVAIYIRMIMEFLEENSKFLFIFLGLIYFLGYFKGKEQNNKKAENWFSRASWLIKKRFPNTSDELM